LNKTANSTSQVAEPKPQQKINTSPAKKSQEPPKKASPPQEKPAIVTSKKSYFKDDIESIVKQTHEMEMKDGRSLVRTAARQIAKREDESGVKPTSVAQN